MLVLLLSITLTFTAKCIFGQQLNHFLANCDDAPTLAIRTTCLTLQRVANNSRRNLEQLAQIIIVQPPGIAEDLRPSTIIPGSRGQVASNPYDCMTLTCLCPYFRGVIDPRNQCVLRNGRILTMANRKEYRMLTEDERLRYHNALLALKRSGEYDRISTQHQSVASSGGAHSGPAFLPWHREYLKRDFTELIYSFEIALRFIDPTVSIPYWDSVLDSYLPDPRDSIFFSQIFMGETDFYGNVISGPFTYWRTLDGRNAILRNLMREGQLFTEWSIAQVMRQNRIEGILAYTAPMLGCPYPINYGALEFSHSNVHLWVGGHMKPPEQSSNDPIFFSHHAFVDFIWELWRKNIQPSWSRESAYPPDIAVCSDQQHFSYALMRPFFTLTNRDGLSNMYTEQMYRYAPRPSCSAEVPTCGTPYLFCDTRGFAHCVSKIKLNGICVGFEGFDACFNGICSMGRCIPGPTPMPFQPRTELSKVQQAVIAQPKPQQNFNDCFNRHPCCETWANTNECRRNPNYMQRYCQAACNICSPLYDTTSECLNRHIACNQWSTAGQCNGQSNHFMLENCRQSCHLCNMPKNVSCSFSK